MCRLAAYAGPPRPLSTLLYDAPHALESQAYQPRSMVRGTVNVDGTGVAWWRGDEAEPLRYVTEKAPWADANLPALSKRIAAGRQLATVRSATPGMPVGVAAALPFVRGPLAGSLNGFLQRFSEVFARPLAARLPGDVYRDYHVATDALLLFLLVAARREQEPQAGLARPLAAVTAEVLEMARAEGVEASVNLVVSDGKEIAATRAAHGLPSNGLFTLEDGARWPGAALVASEPLDDDPGWREVADASVVSWKGGAFTVEPLGTPAGGS